MKPHIALFHRLNTFHPPCNAEGLAVGLEVLQAQWPGAEVHLTFVQVSLQHEADISDSRPSHLEVLQGFASIRVLLPSTAFHMHEQPCRQQCSQITQVKSEQGWGKPEFCTAPCFWFTASQNQKPLLGALCPALCMVAILWKETPTHFLTKNHEDPALFSKCWQQWQYLKPAHCC